MLGCVAQQEGEKIFDRAPYVSLVCGSASYRKLPQMLVQLEAGKQRITGLDDRETDECFETEFTARTNPHRGYLTIIEGCDKFCAYCVVPFTRGKERSRTSESVLAEARQMADLGYTEVQLLGPERELLQGSVGKEDFRRTPGRGGRAPRHPASAVHDFASPGFWTRHYLSHRIGSDACAITCTCRCRAGPTVCSTPCSASTPASITWNALPG